MNQKEKGLLFSLMHDVGLLEKVAVPKKILRGQCLEIFKEIKRQFDKHQSFDYEVAADKLEMRPSELLFEGFLPLDAKSLKRILKEIEKDHLNIKLISVLNKETRIIEKTGTPRDTKKVRKIISDLDALEAKELITTSFSDIKKEPVNWIWKGRIPRGTMTLVAGHPGVGKSFFTTWLIAKLSKGEPLPDEEQWTQGEKTRPYSSLIISAEDDENSIIKPRLEANKADLSRIEFFNRPLDFSVDDLLDLETVLNKRPDICIIIIDPLGAFLGKVDCFRDPDIRQRLMPLIDMAKKRKITPISVAHFNKREDSELITKVSGSIAFTGVARSILGISYDVRDNNDPDAQDVRLLSSLKMNLMRKPDTLAFKIKDDLSILFEKESTKIDPEYIFSKGQREKKERYLFNEQWLLEYLKSGEKSSSAVIEAAQEEGIPQNTLYRAKRKLVDAGLMDTITHGYGKKKESVWMLKTK